MPSPTRLSPDDCALLVVDVQERLVPAVSGGLKLVQSTAFLARWARLAGVPKHDSRITERNLLSSLVNLICHMRYFYKEWPPENPTPTGTPLQR